MGKLTHWSCDQELCLSPCMRPESPSHSNNLEKGLLLPETTYHQSKQMVIHIPFPIIALPPSSELMTGVVIQPPNEEDTNNNDIKRKRAGERGRERNASCIFTGPFYYKTINSVTARVGL